MPTSWILIVHKRYSLLLSLSLYLSEREFSLSLSEETKFVCVTSLPLNFRSRSHRTALAVTRMHESLSHSVTSSRAQWHPPLPPLHTDVCIEMSE